MPEIAERRASVFEVDTLDQLRRKQSVLASVGAKRLARVAYLTVGYPPPRPAAFFFP
jgi:hypothetical protein